MLFTIIKLLTPLTLTLHRIRARAITSYSAIRNAINISSAVFFAVLFLSLTQISYARDQSSLMVQPANSANTSKSVTADQTEKTEQADLSGQNDGKSNKKRNRIEGKLFVNVEGIEDVDSDITANVHAYLEIYKESDKNITNPSYIRYLTSNGVNQIRDALKPYGYYNAKVTVDRLNDRGNTYVNYDVILGEPVVIKSMNINIIGQAKTDKDFIELLKKSALKQGDILNQELYTKLKNQILTQAVSDGYFDGKYDKSEIVLNEKHNEATINITYNSGVRYRFNNPVFTQTEHFLNDDVIARFALFTKGDWYNTKKIANTQRDIYNSGYISLIQIVTKPNKVDKHVAVEFILTRNKNKKFTYGLGYGTDTGFRARFNYDWRWVDELGNKVQAKLFVSQHLINNEIDYIVPAKKIATDYFKFFTIQTKDTRDNTSGYNGNSKSFAIGSAYHDVRGTMERETGIKIQYEDFTIGDDSGISKMLTPYLRLIYKTSDSPLNTYNGLLLDGLVTGANKGFLSNTSFLQAVGKAKYIERIEKNKLTLYGILGYTMVSDFHELPPSYRFFLGGDRTVRGYAYNDIGDRDSNGDVIGGSKMYLASVEYEYFMKDTQALAVFVDAGDAYDDETSKVKVGAGVGFHYYSPIGPIKIDLAHGFDKDIGDKVRIHLTIGPDL